MGNVINAIRLDYYALKAIYKMLAIVYILAVFLGLLAQPGVIFMIVIVFSATFSSMVFSIYEKNNLSNLYGILPLEKSEAVIGRYLYALFFGIINEVIAGSLVHIISPYADKGMNQIAFITYLSASFLYFCLFIGITFPINFKYGFSKANIFTAVPLYIIFMSTVFISRNANAANSLKQVIGYFISNSNMILVAGIGLGVILLVISCALSCLIYKKSEL